MNIGVVVAFIFGSLFIFLGFKAYKNRNYKKNKTKEWISEPRTIAKIEKTISQGSSQNYEGYKYIASILIDGEWKKAQSYDTFFGKRTCKNDEEVEVAYRPIKENKMLNDVMGTMTKTILNKDWNESKPLYIFKFLDEHKYDNEKISNGFSLFLICFGLLIILMGILSYFGIIV